MCLTWVVTAVVGYGVDYTQCPRDPFVRQGLVMSPDEAQWIKGRDSITQPRLEQFLQDARMEDFDPSLFLSLSLKPIRIGLAFSGGGYRAMLAGAGQLAAYDDRTVSSYNPVAGLLQSLSYITGLLGGLWLLSSVVAIDFPAIDAAIGTTGFWDLNRNILDIKGLFNIFTNTLYILSVSLDITTKLVLGMPVTLTDIWGRLLLYNILPGVYSYGSSFQTSDLQKLGRFTNHDMPFPIMVLTLRRPQSLTVDQDSVQFEMNPYEFGSYDPRVASFVQQKYLGTRANKGKAVGWFGLASAECRSKLDNLSFEFGISLSIFNYVFKDFDVEDLPPVIKQIVKLFVAKATEIPIDVARIPNPFMDIDDGNTNIAKNESLFLCDGGFDDQNVPLAPLLQKDREVDVIFAHDNSADTLNWPDGTAVIATYKNQFTEKGSKGSFPPVPNTYTFYYGNLTSRPTFFGCYAQDMIGKVAGSAIDTPLVVYMPNRPFSFWSNTSTFKLTYTTNDRNGMIRNGFEVSTRLNGTLDDEWSACVGCAIVQRERERQGLAPTDQCQRCFDRYCWDGEEYTGPITGDNFDDEGRQEVADKYSLENLEGFRVLPIKRDGVHVPQADEGVLDEKTVMKWVKTGGKIPGEEIPTPSNWTYETVGETRVKRYHDLAFAADVVMDNGMIKRHWQG